jgi:hypothetical protein
MRGDINQSMWRNKWRDKKSACFEKQTDSKAIVYTILSQTASYA